jgi:hypothetical protein
LASTGTNINGGFDENIVSSKEKIKKLFQGKNLQ